jgi:hypothetical protein
MYVVRHLPQPFLARAGGVLGFETFRNVAEDHHVASRKMVRGYRVSHRNSRAVRTKELYLSSLTAKRKEVPPLPKELPGINIELPKRVAEEDLRRSSEKSEGRGIGVHAYAAVVE